MVNTLFCDSEKTVVLITKITREITAFIYLLWLALNMNSCFADVGMNKKNSGSDN